jgi:hypothetical protein
MGKVINVLTHGWNPLAPLGWESFRQRWRDLIPMLNPPGPSSPFWGRVETIQHDWESSQGFTQAAVCLFGAKLAHAHAIDAMRNGQPV